MKEKILGIFMCASLGTGLAVLGCDSKDADEGGTDAATDSDTDTDTDAATDSDTDTDTDTDVDSATLTTLKAAWW